MSLSPPTRNSQPTPSLPTTFRCTICGSTLPWDLLDPDVSAMVGENVGLECVEFVLEANEKLGGVL